MPRTSQWKMLCDKTRILMREIPSNEKKKINYLTVAKELKRLDILNPTLSDVKKAVNNVLGKTATARLNKSRITGLTATRNNNNNNNTVKIKQTTAYKKLKNLNEPPSPKKASVYNRTLKTAKSAFKKLFGKTD